MRYGHEGGMVMGQLIRTSKKTIPVLSHIPTSYRKSGKCGKNRTSRNFPNSGNVGNMGKPVFIGLEHDFPAGGKRERGAKRHPKRNGGNGTKKRAKRERLQAWGYGHE